ncbi:hypothetical protein EGK14_12665 [Erwinia sp. 198]|nr:hypothetical protein EGK14_12665 [Erwinia sp. 198]
MPTAADQKAFVKMTTNLQSCSLLLPRKIIKKRQNREILPLIGYVHRNDIYLNAFILLIGTFCAKADICMQKG